MAERHYLPRQPAEDSVHAVKERRLYGLGQELNSPKCGPEFYGWDGRRLLRPERLVDRRGVDEGGDAYCFAGGWEVLAVEEGAGPILDGVIVWYFWILVTLAAVEGDTAACCQITTSYGLAAAEEAVLKVVYCRRYT